MRISLHSTSRLQPRRLALLLTVLVTLIAAACSSGNDSSLASAASDTATAESATLGADGAFAADEAMDQEVAPDSEPRLESAREAPAVAGLTTGSAAGQEIAQTRLPDLGRDIIFTATLELGSTDVTAATREAIRAVEARGGFLFAQDTRGGSGGSSVLTFKILPEQFQAALNDLGEVGAVRSQSISADDVTAIVVDLQSRINTAEASVERLRKLLDESNDFDRIAALENQLLERETRLEQLRGQLRTVQNQVDLATITVHVTELLNRPAMLVQVSTFAGHDGGFSCFDSAQLRAAEPGDPATICYRITNAGDTPLVDLTLEDPAFGATLGDLVPVEGSTTQLDPGESVVLAQELELEETVRIRSSVTATALDADGNPLADEVRATAAILRLDVTSPDDGIPSFGDVISGSLSALVTIGVIIALVAVAIAPFAVVGAILFWIGSAIWRRLAPRGPEANPTRPPVFDESKLEADAPESTEMAGAES